MLDAPHFKAAKEDRAKRSEKVDRVVHLRGICLMVERLANVANWAEPCSQAAETYFMRDIRPVEEPPT
jgi:hypothetical protein